MFEHSFTTERIAFDRLDESDPARAILVSLALAVGNTVLSGLLFVGVESTVLPALGYGNDAAAAFVAGGTVTLVFTAAMALAYLRYRPVTIPVRVPTLRGWGWGVAGFIGSVVLFLAFAVFSEFVIAVFGSRVGADPATPLVVRAIEQNLRLALGFLFVASFLLIGPIEELLFRGVIQGRVREAFGPVATVVVSGLLFGLAHSGTYLLGSSTFLSLEVLLALLGIAVNGAWYGVLYEWTGNLAVPIIAHALADGISAVVVAMSL